MSDTKNQPNTTEGQSELTAVVSFRPVSEAPPRSDEEYFVRMFKQDVQDKAFTVALWQDGMWWPDAGDESTITHWADMSDFV